MCLVGVENFLLDCHLSPEVEEQISRIALEHDGVEGVHDIRTRRSGQTQIIQLHLEMKGSMVLAESHRVAKEVEADIHDAVPAADIIIHQDPVMRGKG